MATIKRYTKKDGTIAYQFSLYLGVNPKTGKQQRTTRRGFKTKKEAKRVIARLEVGVDEPQTKIHKKYTTFYDVYKLWWENYQQKGLKKSTVEHTALYFKKHILPVFGSLTINAITITDCQKAVNEWAKKQKIFPVYRSYTSNVFDYAIKLNLIKANPMEYVDMPRKTRSVVKDRDKYYTAEELQAFLDWVSTHRKQQDLVFIHLLAFTGMRKGEAYALKWSDVDFNKHLLTINKNMMRVGQHYEVSSTKTLSSDRTIALDIKTIELLKKWHLCQKKDFLQKGILVKKDSEQLIFTTVKNTVLYPDYAQTIIKNYPGKQLTPHGFRHTHATLLLNGGVAPNEVQHRLGHANAAMTLSVYGHATPEDQFVADRFVDLTKTYSKA